MTVADWVIVAIIGLSTGLSVLRGFVREALSLFTWLAAFVIGRIFSPGLAVLLEDAVSTPSARYAAAFAILFAVTLVVGALISHLLKEVIRMTGLSGTDRLLGTVFGAARGLVIITVAVALGWKLFEQDPWWQQSELIPHFVMLEQWSRTSSQGLIQFVLNFGQ